MEDAPLLTVSGDFVRHDWERMVEQRSLSQQERGAKSSAPHILEGQEAEGNAGAPGFFPFIPHNPQLMGQCLSCSD